MRRNRILLTLGIVLPMATSAFWLVTNSRAATETPAYKVILSDGKFETRDYPALTLAGTPMEGSDMDGSFMRLFRFIAGGNAGAEKIAMTTPVLIDARPQQRTMSFIMPEKTVEKGVPAPTGASVTVGQTAPSRFAVLRFGGGRSAENEARAARALQAWAEARHLATEGAPLFAYYDPPWTPVFLRRNEVMLKLRPGGAR